MASAIRFGLGRWDGLHSATWRVSAGKDGSVYLIDRAVGHLAKVSLHARDPSRPGGEWRIAFSDAAVAARARPDQESPGRLIEEWDSETTRLPDGPFRQAFAVVLGRPSLGYEPLPDDPIQSERVRRHLTRGVDWSTPMPSVDELWQFTVLIADPHIRTTAPGTGSMGAVPVGSLELPSTETVWVMRTKIPYTADRQEQVRQQMQTVVSAAPRPEGTPRVRRAHLLGAEPEGLRWILDVAVTFGPIPPAIENF
jgi:hypothetical protein